MFAICNPRRLELPSNNFVFVVPLYAGKTRKGQYVRSFVFVIYCHRLTLRKRTCGKFKCQIRHHTHTIFRWPMRETEILASEQAIQWISSLAHHWSKSHVIEFLGFVRVHKIRIRSGTLYSPRRSLDLGWTHNISLLQLKRF